MEGVINGKTREVVVECKHRNSVTRPMVQKLHSAASTYTPGEEVKSIFITTGTFTKPAKEEARDLTQNKGPVEMELINGHELQELADEVGLNLKNGKIQILCDEMLRPYNLLRKGTTQSIAEEQLSSIENINKEQF